MNTIADALPKWRRLTGGDPLTLVDARLQLHHALQVIVCAPISFLMPRADDGHTNLEWLPQLDALGTNWLEGAVQIRFALRPEALSLLAVDAAGGVTSEYALDGRTTMDAVGWLRDALDAAGYDVARFTTKKHYEIPLHAVASGAAYKHQAEACAELARCYADAHELTSYVVATRADASPPRCWPHHFDLATLMTLPADAGRGTRTIGVGLSPGDDSYAEPYVYVGPYPHPRVERLRPLGALGTWHTRGWVGAVLRTSELVPLVDARRQAQAVRAFTDAAIDASMDALSKT